VPRPGLTHSAAGADYSAASYRPAFAALHNPASAFRTLVAAAGSSLPPATLPMGDRGVE